MEQVLLIWTESNPSTMEKEFLLLNGLVKSGLKAQAVGFSHSKSNREYFETVYAKKALYSYSFGSKRYLFQGRNYLEKLFSNLVLFFWFSVKLYKLLRNQPASVIIIPTNPFEITFPALVLGKIFGVRVVPNIMEYEPALTSFHTSKFLFMRWSWTLIMKYSDAYIVISRFLEEKIGQLTTKPIFRLPAILEWESHQLDGHVPECRRLALEMNDSPILIFSGSPGYGDLLGFCFEALSHLRDKRFHLVVTGKYSMGMQNQLIAQARAHGIQESVSFSGFLTDQEMRDLQICSMGLLMPLLNTERHRARFPQKVLSYMRLGRPLLTTKVGELGELFKDGASALIDESVTAHGFSEKIRFLLDFPEEAREIGVAGGKYAEAAFNEVVLGKRLAGFLGQVVGK